MNLLRTVESDIQRELSEADKGRTFELSGNRLAPIETLAEPRVEENPFPMTLNKTDPVKPGNKDATNTGERASNVTVDVDDTLIKAAVTMTKVARIVPEETLQFVDESEIHLEDSHEHPDRDMNCEVDSSPKRKPITDKETEPVLAALKNGGELTWGSEYDNDSDGPLLKTPTEEIAGKPRPLPEENLQRTPLLEIQFAASAAERPSLICTEESERPSLLPNTEIWAPPVPGFKVTNLADDMTGES